MAPAKQAPLSDPRILLFLYQSQQLYSTVLKRVDDLTTNFSELSSQVQILYSDTEDREDRNLKTIESFKKQSDGNRADVDEKIKAFHRTITDLSSRIGRVEGNDVLELRTEISGLLKNLEDLTERIDQKGDNRGVDEMEREPSLPPCLPPPRSLMPPPQKDARDLSTECETLDLDHHRRPNSVGAYKDNSSSSLTGNTTEEPLTFLPSLTTQSMLTQALKSYHQHVGMTVTGYIVRGTEILDQVSASGSTVLRVRENEMSRAEARVIRAFVKGLRYAELKVAFVRWLDQRGWTWGEVKELHRRKLEEKKEMMLKKSKDRPAVVREVERSQVVVREVRRSQRIAKRSQVK